MQVMLCKCMAKWIYVWWKLHLPFPKIVSGWVLITTQMPPHDQQTPRTHSGHFLPQTCAENKNGYKIMKKIILKTLKGKNHCNRAHAVSYTMKTLSWTVEETNKRDRNRKASANEGHKDKSRETSRYYLRFQHTLLSYMKNVYVVTNVTHEMPRYCERNESKILEVWCLYSSEGEGLRKYKLDRLYLRACKICKKCHFKLIAAQALTSMQ